MSTNMADDQISADSVAPNLTNLLYVNKYGGWPNYPRLWRRVGLDGRFNLTITWYVNKYGDGHVM